MPETHNIDAEPAPTHEKSQPSQDNEGQWFVEGAIFKGTKEEADQYVEHIKAENEKKQFRFEAAVNKASDRPILPRKQKGEVAPYTEEVIRAQGFLDDEFAALTAGWANRMAESYESGDMKDDDEAKELAKLHRGVVDMLDSGVTEASINQKIAKLQSQIESYQKSGIPAAGVEWKLKTALKAKDLLTEMHEDFEASVKNHMLTARGIDSSDIQIARKVVADEYITGHNDKLSQQRAEAPKKKQDIIQNARVTAARSDLDEVIDAARRVTMVPDESERAEVPKTPKEAEALIDASPDLMRQLFAEASAYATQIIENTQDPKVIERVQKEQGRLQKIEESFQELAKLWQAEGKNKSYQEFCDGLEDKIADRKILYWLADADPTMVRANSLLATSKLAMAKRMSKPNGA